MSKHERLAAPPTGPHAVEDLGEGYNAAWWTITGMGILAAAVGVWAVIALNMVLGVIAAVLVVATIVVGVVMTKMGMGSYTFEKGDTAEGSPSVGIK